MKQSKRLTVLRWIAFFLMIVVNLSLIYPAATYYVKGAPFLFPVFLIAQVIFTVLNFLVSEKMFQLIILSVELLLSTIIAHIVCTLLYYHNVSSDAETLLVGQYEVLLGSFFVIVISLIAIFIKRALIKKRAK